MKYALAIVGHVPEADPLPLPLSTSKQSDGLVRECSCLCMHMYVRRVCAHLTVGLAATQSEPKIH
jgi:hypothetical protein